MFPVSTANRALISGSRPEIGDCPGDFGRRNPGLPLISVLVALVITPALLSAAPWTLSVRVPNPYPSPYISDWQNTPSITVIPLMYFGQQAVRVRLEARLYHQGTELASGQSDEIAFSPPGGSVTYDNRDFWRYRDFHYSPSHREAVERSGRLPEGSYRLWVRVYDVSTNAGLAEAEGLFWILSFTTPSLIAPANGSTVSTSNPTFQWTPATTHPGFQATYWLRICELREGQTPELAINNTPFFTRSLVNTTSFIYPNDAPALVAGKTYVWQVRAVGSNNWPLGENQGRSEIWLFGIARGVLKEGRPPEPGPEPPPRLPPDIQHISPPVRVYPPGGISVRHIVTREPDRAQYHVILQVSNVGDRAAEFLAFCDSMIGFQAVGKYKVRKRASSTAGWEPWSSEYRLQTTSNLDVGRQGTGGWWVPTREWSPSRVDVHWQDDVDRLSRVEPGAAIEIAYDVVPVLHIMAAGERRRYGYEADNYVIGNRTVVGHGTAYNWRRYSYSSPHRPGSEIYDALRTSDYLIVTSPYFLKLANPGGEEDVQRLLATTAELAVERNGVLANSVGGDGFTCIIKRTGWLANLLHRDWCEEGYLLLVGENFVVKSFVRGEPDSELISPLFPVVSIFYRPTVSEILRGLGFAIDAVHVCDLPYANPERNGAPRIKVGRIVGRTANDLIASISTALAVARGERRQRVENALLLEGPLPEYQRDYVGWRDLRPFVDILRERGVSSDRLVVEDFWERYYREVLAPRNEEFHPESDGWMWGATSREIKAKIGMGDKDLIIHSGHGSSLAWHRVLCNQCGCGTEEYISDQRSPLEFGSSAPVIFSSGCHTGDYRDPSCFARAILERGAAVYIGPAQVSIPPCTREMGKHMIRDHWRPGVSVGTVLRDAKTSVWGMTYCPLTDPNLGAGARFLSTFVIGGVYEGLYDWTARIFNLYGDPKTWEAR